MRARPLARLIAILGAVGVGWLLLDARPRDVVLVYDVSRVSGATALEVEIRSRGEIVRRARLRVEPGEQQRHPVRLREGAYRLAWRLDRLGGALEGERDLVIMGEETIVLPLGP
jgi:hypothetical protein